MSLEYRKAVSKLVRLPKKIKESEDQLNIAYIEYQKSFGEYQKRILEVTELKDELREAKFAVEMCRSTPTKKQKVEDSE